MIFLGSENNTGYLLLLLLVPDCKKDLQESGREGWAVKRRKKNNPTSFVLRLGSFSIDFCAFPILSPLEGFPVDPHTITTTKWAFCLLSPPGQILFPAASRHGCSSSSCQESVPTYVSVCPGDFEYLWTRTLGWSIFPAWDTDLRSSVTGQSKRSFEREFSVTVLTCFHRF